MHDTFTCVPVAKGRVDFVNDEDGIFFFYIFLQAFLVPYLIDRDQVFGHSDESAIFSKGSHLFLISMSRHKNISIE